MITLFVLGGVVAFLSVGGAYALRARHTRSGALRNDARVGLGDAYVGTMVKLEGLVRCNENLLAPAADEKCAAFECEIYTEDADASPIVTTIMRVRAATTFTLKTTEGDIEVRPGRYNFQLAMEFATTKIGTEQNVLSNVMAYLDPPAQAELQGYDPAKLLFREVTVFIGQKVQVQGIFQQEQRPSREAGYRGDARVKFVVPPELGSILIGDDYK